MFKPDNGGLEPKNYQKALSNISISGYYRFLGAYTTMDTQYPEMGEINNRVFLGDDSNLPELSMTLGISPTRNTSISTDLYLWNPLTGSDQDYVQGLLLGVNLYGTHSTKYGTFGVRTGGIHWHRLSPLTFAANTGYNRFSIFERNPWDPNTRSMFDRYETYYENGALTQDVRWGQQAFHGFILDGADLPMDFSFSLMHGKTQLNGGAAPTPNQFSGGRIRKGLGDHFISLNGVRSKTFSDSLAREVVGYNMLTTEYEFKWKEKITFYGEVGAGNYFSPDAEGNWGEVIDVRLQFQKELTHFPIEVRYFRISQNALNNNGIFFNTSIQEYVPVVPDGTVGGAPLLFPFASSVTSIGQLTNNRQGLILNTDLNVGRHKLTIGYSAAVELEGLSDRITYGHPANNLQLSRFWRWDFPAGVGPYDNISKVFRGAYETMLITDSITAKGFNSIEVSFKTHTTIFNRKLMFFYLGGFHNVQSSFSALPVYSDEAYLRSFNHQLEFYYELTRNITLSNYLGYDRIRGGQNTEVDATSQRAKNQEGLSYAIGMDIQLSKNTGLYIRHRWMKYQDFSFELDRYNGMETTVEFKIFF